MGLLEPYRILFGIKVLELALLVLFFLVYGLVAKAMILVGSVLVWKKKDSPASVVFLLMYLLHDDGWLFPLLELLLSAGVLQRWPISNDVCAAAPLTIVDGDVVFEQITEANIAEVGRFWAQTYPWTEPCGRHLFKEFEGTKKNKIESELAIGFPHFFAVNIGLGFFARCAKTREVIGYRFAHDAAQSKWSIEERFLRWLTRWYIMNQRWFVAKFARDVFRFAIPDAYWMFLPTPALCWSQEENFERAFRKVDLAFDTFEPNVVLNLFGFGVRDDFLGKGVASRMTLACLQHAADLGFKKVQVWCTNTTSRHVFLDKLSFTQIASTPYSDFRAGQLQPFVGVVDHFGKAQPDHFCLIKTL